MKDWKDKRVIVIGAARQGLALGRYLAEQGARVVMNDLKPADQLVTAMDSFSDMDAEASSRVEWVLGGHPIALLEGADYVCPSGGVSLDLAIIQEAMKRGILLTNDSQVFLEACPCRTIGITGSAGKTTTTSLVGDIAHTAIRMGVGVSYRKAWVGGNIGSPLISDLSEMKPNDLAVLELSSFQLELMTRSVNIACILNLTPNHLDRHSSMEAYIAAKRRILEYQSSRDIAVLGRDDTGAWNLRQFVLGECATFGKEAPPTGMKGAYIDNEQIWVVGESSPEAVLRVSEIQLPGWHNVENVLAACTISLVAGLPVAAMREAIPSFTGVPHRLEYLLTFRGADWYNDSIATAPERVIAAIHSFESPRDLHRSIVLLAGGRDKNLPWDDLARLIHQRVKHLILFGEAAEKIARAVRETRLDQLPETIESYSGLEQAVEAAVRLVQPGDIVLLSPGGTSFDEFRDFEERGEAFKRWVSNLSCK